MMNFSWLISKNITKCCVCNHLTKNTQGTPILNFASNSVTMSSSPTTKKFQTEEKQLIDELRRLCDHYGSEKIFEAAADIFNQMGHYFTKQKDLTK